MAKVFAGEKVKAIFRAWDLNGDGLIDNKEFAKAFSSMGSSLDVNALIAKMEEEVGKGGVTEAAGADKKFSYEEFIDWLKLDAEIVVKYSTMLPIWTRIAGGSRDDHGGHPEDITVNFSEMAGFEKTLMAPPPKGFGFTQDMAMKAQMDMSYFSNSGRDVGDYVITFKKFLEILKLNPAIDYIDDSKTCDMQAVRNACNKIYMENDPYKIK